MLNNFNNNYWIITLLIMPILYIIAYSINKVDTKYNRERAVPLKYLFWTTQKQFHKKTLVAEDCMISKKLYW